MLDNNFSNQPSKFRTKNWVEINDESKESYSYNSDIRLKTTMLRSKLCESAHAYILVKRTITISGGRTMLLMQIKEQLNEIRV